MDEIIFLGSCGGRIATMLQARGTGGIILICGEHQIHIDPGPGAIVRAKQFRVNLQKTDILCISHPHVDHVNDVPIVLEAMTGGAIKKRGVLIGPKSCIEGDENHTQCVPEYIKKMLEEIFILKEGDEVAIDESLRIRATKVRHNNANGIGFKFITKKYILSYLSDTEYFDELVDEHKGSNIIIVNLLRPNGERWKGQLCTEDAVELISKIKPRVAIITHFGMKVLKEDPTNEARILQQKTGVRVIAAKDGLRLKINEILME